ncbi:hypothetical protein E4U30_006487 [Claviceps sp. LM220 group G6]|nr:hypothetical protein E4U30_006487 [Claviceps sp. LM220 group G6]
MMPVVEPCDGNAAADASPTTITLTTESNKWTRIEECDEALGTKAFNSRRRSREHIMDRKRRGDGAAVSQSLGFEREPAPITQREVSRDASRPLVGDNLGDHLDLEDGEHKESEDLFNKRTLMRKPVQARNPDRAIGTSLLLSHTPPPTLAGHLGAHPMGQEQKGPPPPPLPPLTASPTLDPDNSGSSQTFKIPWKPRSWQADIPDPIQLARGNTPNWNSQTVDGQLRTPSPFTAQDIGSPTAIGSSYPALTRIITVPNSVLSSTDAGRVLQVQSTIESNADPTERPGEPTARPITPTNVVPGTGYGESPEDHNSQHEQTDGQHDNTDKALIAVGSTGWLFWRTSRRRRRHSNHDIRMRPQSSHSRDSSPPSKPRRLVTKTLSRIPIVRGHIRSRETGWTNLDHSSHAGPSKGATALSVASTSSMGAQQQSNQAPAIVVHTEIVRKSYIAPSKVQLPEETLSPNEAQHNNGALGAGGDQQKRSHASDMSSLSSSFGDGLSMSNNNNNNNNNSINNNSYEKHDLNDILNGTHHSNNNHHSSGGVVTTINAPLPVAQRDSAHLHSERSQRDIVQTDVPEDAPLRLRTVSSWVKQQSGKVTRARQRLQSVSSSHVASEVPSAEVPKMPSEQDLRLMMSNGEELRRAEAVSGRGVAR